MPVRAIRGVLLALAIVLASSGVCFAQSPSDAEKKLQRVRGELKSVARERRKLEGERGDASRKLRAADEQVGQSSRTLSETEAALQREAAALAELQERRQGMQLGLGEQRRELAELVRNAYMLGSDAPLKVLLSQDRAADAQRALAYHRYVQGDRARRIGELTTGLQALETLEREIQERRKQLAHTREQHRGRIAQLERDRQQRAVVVAELDKRFQDRSSREKALGRDAKSLERLLANLRAAARRAEAERRAALKRAASDRAAAERAAAAGGDAPRRSAAAVPAKPPVRPVVASAAAPKVGGLGWPLSGNLLARFGGKLPDGRASGGVLIGAAAGSTVSAVADGSVVFAEWMTGYGLILIVDHGNGYMSLYAHNDSLLRDAGDVVKRGDALAKVGSSGGQGVPALYFELRRNGEPVDPATWLQRR